MVGRSTCNCLWSPDCDAVWDAVAPILFPVVGRTHGRVIRVDGRTYPDGRARLCGQARLSRDRGRLPNGWSSPTRPKTTRGASIPFDYGLRVAFELAATSLTCTVTVDECGQHCDAVRGRPASRLPLACRRQRAPDVRRATKIRHVPVITPDGLFAAARRPLAFDGRHLLLTRDLLACEALCFLDTRSSAFTYEADGFRSASPRARQRSASRAVVAAACAVSMPRIVDGPRRSGRLHGRACRQAIDAPAAAGSRRRSHAAVYDYTPPV